ncbi:hypothetical protein M427DRAFT_37532 [Gonapodya prolifera JEL478]|uniref:Uncharacterized protein n=1 Tax=Gonapodya prolifera (strain JEL478) TaxID=1344416 RepID=A0A139A0E9_GONPJ|nr:hypothetical protein M427DRAFT_37532 [Gonapodya prolifera JEL478]|eukprot:KXS10257.1 hypothetical protein M427DRAFT_37532 [Gonapodya prolifera JEL478]
MPPDFVKGAGYVLPPDTKEALDKVIAERGLQPLRQPGVPGRAWNGPPHGQRNGRNKLLTHTLALLGSTLEREQEQDYKGYDNGKYVNADTVEDHAQDDYDGNTHDSEIDANISTPELLAIGNGGQPPLSAIPTPPPWQKVDYSQSSANIQRMLDDIHHCDGPVDYATYWCAAHMQGSVRSLPPQIVIQDSGAALSAISAEFYHKKFHALELDTWMFQPITVGNGIIIAPIGSLLLPVTVGGVRRALRFAVIKGLPHNFLLGANFLRIWRAVID